MDTKNLFHDRYFLERLLGRGNFSEVWLAKDDKTDIEVALKIYAPATGLDDHGLNVLSREFAIVVNANHMNLLRPLHYDTWERKPYLVLPYRKHGSILKSVGQFSEEEAWHLFHDVAAGLAYLHAMTPTVIHQDIKPDNIMVADDGRYEITDFGVSAHAKSTLRKSMSMAFASAGTTAYMAPERFSKDNTPVKANDIWSLGAMVYEMLTGDPPFGESGGLFQKRGADIPELPGDYDPTLKRLITMCLHEDPWNRPTAAQVEAYAQIYLDGGNPFPEPEPWYRKHKMTLTIASAVLFVAALSLTVLLFRPASQPAQPELTGIAKASHLLKNASTASEGFTMLGKMADEGHVDALYLLSRLYFKSRNISDFCPDSIREMQQKLNLSPDNKKAHVLLLQTIEKAPNNYHALYELGCDYLGGEARTDAVGRDIGKADAFYRKAMKYAMQAHDKHYEELIGQQMDKYAGHSKGTQSNNFEE